MSSLSGADTVRIESCHELLTQLLKKTRNFKANSQDIEEGLHKAIGMLQHIVPQQKSTESNESVGPNPEVKLTRLEQGSTDTGENDVLNWIAREFATQTLGDKSEESRKSASDYYKSAQIAATFIARMRYGNSSAWTAKGMEGLKPEEKAARVLRQVLHNAQLRKLSLEGVCTWSFDIFALNKASHQRPLSCLLTHFLTELDIFNSFKVPKTSFTRFVSALEDGYLNNPYHNALHAADVTQSMYWFLSRPSFSELVSSVDMFAGLIAAAIHDFRHPGTNNHFHIATGSNLAILYNDQSVLENYHLAEAYKLMTLPGYDIFQGMSPQLRSEVRASIVSMVLATDMKHHFSMVSNIRSAVASKRAEKKWFAHTEPKDRGLVMECAMHSADLGNPGKPLSQCLEWTKLVMEEFWAQGDKEKELGLPISPMCDRNNTNVPQTQIGFISYVVRPLYVQFGELCPEVKQTVLPILDENLAHWKAELAKQSDGESKTESKSSSSGTTTTTTTADKPSSSDSAQQEKPSNSQSSQNSSKTDGEGS